MTVAFIASWTGTGILAGVALAAYSRRLLISTPSRLLPAGLAASLLTGCAFGGLAWRLGYRFDLLPYSVLAAIGVALGLIDLIEQRLPSKLVCSGLVLIGALLVTSTILYPRWPDFLRALAGMAILAAFYLLLALASQGGLGAGDVKLGGLLGLALGWLSWSALAFATFLGWFAAALVWLVARMTRRGPKSFRLPMGPFLLLGAIPTICAMPT